MRKVRNRDDGNCAPDPSLGAASDVRSPAANAPDNVQPQATVEGGLARQLVKITEPGIYRDFDGPSYFADPCPDPSLSQSIAKVIIERSAKHAMLQHPRLAPATTGDDEAEKYVKAQAIGNAAHQIMLGRGKAVEIIKADDFRGKEAKAKRDEASAAGRVPILEKHMTGVEKMVKAANVQLEDHEDCDAFTNGSGEVMIAWQENGIWFRSLIDWLHDDLRTVDDYKTTQMSVAPHVIGIRAESANWHVQAAFIERGLDILDPAGAGRRKYRFIAQEGDAEPYALTVMHMNEHWLTMGRKKVDAAVMLWTHAIETGEWRGYTNRSVIPDYPGWSENRWLEREISEFAEPPARGKKLTSLMGG
jgi:hypothetical protein